MLKVLRFLLPWEVFVACKMKRKYFVHECVGYSNISQEAVHNNHRKKDEISSGIEIDCGPRLVGPFFWSFEPSINLPFWHTATIFAPADSRYPKHPLLNRSSTKMMTRAVHRFTLLWATVSQKWESWHKVSPLLSAADPRPTHNPHPQPPRGDSWWDLRS